LFTIRNISPHSLSVMNYNDAMTQSLADPVVTVVKPLAVMTDTQLSSASNVASAALLKLFCICGSTHRLLHGSCSFHILVYRCILCYRCIDVFCSLGCKLVFIMFYCLTILTLCSLKKNVTWCKYLVQKCKINVCEVAETPTLADIR
jgi:hypothetical protein